MRLGKRGEPAKEKLSSLEVVRRLDDLFIGRGSPDAIHKLKEEFSITASETEIFLCLAAQYLVGFLDAFQSREGIPLPQGLFKTIAQGLADSILMHGSLGGPPHETHGVLYQKLKKITDGLLEVWERHEDKAPNPQWYVAKEVCYLLNGRDKMPHPGLVTLLSSQISNDTKSIKKLFKELEKTHVLVK